MDVKACIEQRRSVRRYLDGPVAQDLVDEVLEAGRLAPSGGNIQPWRFMVVRDDAMRQALKACSYGQQFVADAPLIIVGCGVLDAYDRVLGKRPDILDPELGQGAAIREFQVKNACVNVSTALEHMALRAVSLGLATCWVREFRDYEIHRVLPLAPNLIVVALLCLGYPDESPPARPRKLLSEIVLPVPLETHDRAV